MQLDHSYLFTYSEQQNARSGFPPGYFSRWLAIAAYLRVEILNLFQITVMKINHISKTYNSL